MAKIEVAKATINAGRKAFQKLQNLIDPEKIPRRAGKVPSNPRKDQTLNEQKKKIITDFYNRYVEIEGDIPTKGTFNRLLSSDPENFKSASGTRFTKSNLVKDLEFKQGAGTGVIGEQDKQLKKRIGLSAVATGQAKMSPKLKSKAEEIFNVDNPQRLQGGHAQTKSLHDSDFGLHPMDIKKGIDRNLFTKFGNLKKSFVTTAKRNKRHLDQENKLEELLKKRKRIFEKSKESSNYLDNEYLTDLEFNTEQIKEIDRIMRDLRVQTIYKDPVNEKIKYIGGTPESVSKLANLFQGRVGTTPGAKTGMKDGGEVKLEYDKMEKISLVKPEDKNIQKIRLVKPEDENLEYIKNNRFSEGGLVGGPNLGSFSIEGLGSNNKVGVLESMLAGVGSGLIQIPKGAFSLGASLLDLGMGTNNAAKIEKYFDDLTDLDEKAEKTFLGNMTQLLVNLGVPGGAAFKIGSGLTKKALLSKKNGNYFKMSDPKLIEKFGTALDTKGRVFATMGGGGAVAVSDMIFAGDVEDIGTLGDMFGGPTELLPNDSDNAAREVMNRIKFGAEGALLLGALGATGSALKTAIKRRDELGSNNEKIDYFLSGFRPRGRKTQEFFDLERENIGLRQGDVNYASEVSRKLDKHIDAIFPYVKNPFNKMGNDGRRDFMKELNDTLLSGDVIRDAKGDIRFGPMSSERLSKINKLMRDKGAKQKDIDGVIDSFEMIRGGWGHMFTRLGTTLDDAGKDEFAELFSKKFRDYLGSTYEIFRNKSLIPLFNYRPTEQAVEKAIKMFQDSAELAGKGPLSREQAEYYVNRLVETTKPVREISTKADKTSGIYFNAPDFFLNKTTLSDIERIGDGVLPLDEVMKAERQIIEEVLGKVEDPLQTVLNGTNRLSMVTRRRQFYNTLSKEDAELALKRLKFVEENPGVAIPKEMRGFFRDTEIEAINAFGPNVKKIEIEPGKTIEAGITDSLNGQYAPKGVAEAIEESAMVAKDKTTLTQIYENFVLYPKATSQLAKTVLSPITHVRNFVSASAFTTANGLIPGLTVSFDDTANAFKEAYRQLQIPGARQANDRYRELLRLGVVNNNVRLGDLQRLLNDVNFGETFSSTKALRDLMRPFSKGKKILEDFYTAEDDFWKMTTFALERNRIKNVRKKYGMDISDDVLDRAAADIVKNNVPNYDMVSEFIKGIRRVPFGNFVSFPAEIIRTSMNILDTAKKEIFTPHTLDDGRIVYPFRNIGLKRLFGFTTTAVGVPTALTAGFSALYDVTEEEIDALRRFVPEWSKNSTLIPIRDEEGDLKYIDFSHTNAYDTVVRPFRTMINGVREGIEEGQLTKNVISSMIEATTETASPFIGESIWFEGMTDIFIRNGRTREGRRLWTDQTPLGDQMLAGIKHLGATQLPGSLPAFVRLYQAATDTPDEYGREFEIPDEALGLFGFRAIEVDPVRAMKFKIADFSTGIRNARREFTGPLLRGGEISAEQVVDQFQIANRALYNVQNKMFKDYYAARLLGSS